jgi:hypothetical protein
MVPAPASTFKRHESAQMKITKNGRTINETAYRAPGIKGILK